jgi:hypothetical protein|tara:strand:+ start:1843 stop:2166 length:324 start_codon:yes stop_codon:yes gene_type:complete
MAINRFFNITGSTGVTVELIAPFAQTNNISSVTLTNIHDTADATVTLFLEDQPASGASNRFNIIHTIAIPSDSSLVLEGNDIPSIPDNFGTYITVGSSDTVDVMINI